MDVVLCHRTADFDALGAAVAYTCLYPGTRIVLCGGSHPAVHDFLAFYRDEYPLIERRAVSPDQLRTIAVVDTQRRELLGSAAEWLDVPGVEVRLYDHHPQAESDIPAQYTQLESVGSTTTLLVERLQQQSLPLTMAQTTVMALGIHVDTGSLTYDHATVRDAAALTWLMAQGANQRAIAQYIEPRFSNVLQDLLGEALAQLQTATIHGYQVAWVLLSTTGYVPGLSSLTAQLMILSESDALLLGHFYQTRSSQKDRLTVIARSRIDGVNLAELLKPVGGGGHPQAAAATLHTEEPQVVLTQLAAQLHTQIPWPPVATDLMSSPVRTILPNTTIDQARRVLLRYGHSGLSVVDAEGQLVGILSRRDLDIALHHEFGHAPVKGYMSAPVRTITPETSLPDIETLMVTYDIGRLPVLSQNRLVGIVTRTDILRQIHRLKHPLDAPQQTVVRTSLRDRLDQALSPPLQNILTRAAHAARQRGWQLYLVGGAVRDLLLATEHHPVTFREFDLVVDSVETQNIQGAGVELARDLQQVFPDVQLQVYGQFQTASLIWHRNSDMGAFSGTFSVDIATARSEFYPYPAANPEVTASSIRQDLYRRDFSVNALAIRLTQTQRGQSGELLDFFGGLDDLRHRKIRVLHPNSFIEDPTRIFRAVRFATRLQFELDDQTESYVRTAIASGIYQHIQKQHIQKNGDKAPALQSRLRNELQYSFKLPHWPDALALMAHLGALQCLHQNLGLDRQGWRRLKLARCWLERFDPNAQCISPWLMILETLLLSLSESERCQVAANLHLGEQTQSRLGSMAIAQAQITSRLENPQPPSQVANALQSFDLPLLIEIAVSASLSVRRQIWLYLDRWQQVNPLLNGADLIRLGYRPGPQFKVLLASILSATLDGEIQTQDDAIAWIREHYPQS